MKPEETQTIALHAGDTKLLAIQPVGGDWQPLAVPANGEVSATIPDGPFTLVSVCDEPEFFDYYVIFGGTGLTSLDLYCKTPANAVTVKIADSSRARAAIGNFPLRGGSSWKLAPGTYDITAYDDTLTPPRFEIRRGVSITADTEITFDLATTGSPLEEIAVTTDALATEAVAKSARLHTAGGTRMTIPATNGSTRVWRVPASALVTGDRQTITATAMTESGDASRTATRAIPNTAVSIELKLPAGISAVTAAFSPQQRATWQSTTDWNEAFFYASTEDGSVIYDALVTDEYVAQTGALTSIEMPVPTSVPGWNPAWKVPAMTDLEWSLMLTRRLQGLDSDGAGRSGRFAATLRP